jgi:hypothetical protein
MFALEFGKPKIFCFIIVYKVGLGRGIAPRNCIEFLLRDYGF